MAKPRTGANQQVGLQIHVILLVTASSRSSAGPTATALQTFLFPKRPDRLWGPPSLLWGSFMRVKQQGSDVYQYQSINLLKPTGYMMHQQFNIQQLYVLPTLYLCVLYLSENKQRLVPLTA